MRERSQYIVRKVLRYGLIFFIIITLNFLLPRIMPGDPFQNVVGEYNANLNETALQNLRHQYGLDKPLFEQYGIYLGSIIDFDFGYSISNSEPVSDLIARNLCWSMALLIPSVIFASIIGLVVGTYSGMRSGRKADGVLTVSSMLVYTLPTFMIAMVFLSVFSFDLGWFPTGRVTSGGIQDPSTFAVDVLYHLALPIIILTIVGANTKYLMVRNSVAVVKDEYYIFAAKARGLPGKLIRRRYVVRNIMPQFLSMVALNIGFMVSGSILIEMVFSLNGMGNLISSAILVKDYPLIQGCFLVITVSVLLANLTAEVLFGLLDPRVGDMNVVRTR